MNIWTELYRPREVEDYVFQNPEQKEQVNKWISQGKIPHLLFSGSPGTGKTTLAKLLIHKLGVQDHDILEINASRERGIDIVKEKVTTFAETMPFGRMKIILLDEADYTTADFQAALRNDMEAYHTTVRYILTCNYQYKIIPALKSRCHEFHIAKTDMTEFTARAATVLVTEDVEFELDTLDTYVRATYPDLRKCLNQLQVNSNTGKLLSPVSSGASEHDLLVEATELFKNGKILEGRQQLMQYIRSEEHTSELQSH